MRRLTRSGFHVLCLVLAVGATAVSAQSDQELDDVTMRMISDDEELSGSMAREIELDAPEEMEADPASEPGGPEEDVGEEVRDDVGTNRESVLDDVLEGSDKDLTELPEQLDDEMLDEEGDLTVPIDDAVEDVRDEEDDIPDTPDDDLGDTGDDLDDTTDDVDDTLDP